MPVDTSPAAEAIRALNEAAWSAVRLAIAAKRPPATVDRLKRIAAETDRLVDEVA